MICIIKSIIIITRPQKIFLRYPSGLFILRRKYGEIREV